MLRSPVGVVPRSHSHSANSLRPRCYTACLLTMFSLALRCMAACELARVAPTEALIEPLLRFISDPIEGYEDIPGAGGKSTGDAAFSITKLPLEVQRQGIPGICDRLDQTRSFDTIPLVVALISATFPRSKEPLSELNSLQRYVLGRMVDTAELWSIGNLHWTFKSVGLPKDRQKMRTTRRCQCRRGRSLEIVASGPFVCQHRLSRKGARRHPESDRNGPCCL